MLKDKYYFIYDTLLGKVIITEVNNKIVSIDFNVSTLDGIMLETDLLREIHHQINEYLNGLRKSFDISADYSLTPFQSKVMEAIKGIPYGETCSYKDIAIKIGNPNASRAVGMACNKNPLPLVIPCHRVIGSNGKLVGYALGLDMKKKLLELEKKL